MGGVKYEYAFSSRGQSDLAAAEAAGSRAALRAHSCCGKCGGTLGDTHWKVHKNDSHRGVNMMISVILYELYVPLNMQQLSYDVNIHTL